MVMSDKQVDCLHSFYKHHEWGQNRICRDCGFEEVPVVNCKHEWSLAQFSKDDEDETVLKSFFVCRGCLSKKDYEKHLWDVVDDLRFIVTNLVRVQEYKDSIKGWYETKEFEEAQKRNESILKVLEELEGLG